MLMYIMALKFLAYVTYLLTLGINLKIVNSTEKCYKKAQKVKNWLVFFKKGFKVSLVQKQVWVVDSIFSKWQHYYDFFSTMQ